MEKTIGNSNKQPLAKENHQEAATIGQDGEVDLNTSINSTTAFNIGLAARIEEIKAAPQKRFEERLARLREKHGEAVAVLSAKTGWIPLSTLKAYASELALNQDSLLLIRRTKDPRLNRQGELTLCQRGDYDVISEPPSHVYEEALVVNQAAAARLEEALELDLLTKTQLGIKPYVVRKPEGGHGLRYFEFDIRPIPSEWSGKSDWNGSSSS